MEQTINIHVTDSAGVPSTGFFTAFGNEGTATASNALLIVICLITAAIILYLLITKRKKSILLPLFLSILSTSGILLATNLQSASSAAPDEIIPAGETINLEVQRGGSASISTFFSTDTLAMYTLNSYLATNLPEGVTVEVSTTPLTEISQEISPETSEKTQILNLTAHADESTTPGIYTTQAIYEINETREYFAFTIDTRMTDTLDTDPTHYDGTETYFVVPTNGRYDENFHIHEFNDYDWVIDWGDGTAPETFTGSTNIDGPVSHDYAAPGEYQVTVFPNGPTTDGWLDAWGGTSTWLSLYTAFKSIDSPVTDRMRSKHMPYRFGNMFSHMPNMGSIPHDLFRHIDTTDTTNFEDMFFATFFNSAYNSTTATIPAGLFDSIDTTNATSLSGMFESTFCLYAMYSSTGSIPEDLFSSIDTTNATDLSNLFYETFSSFADSNLSLTIPENLFSSIDTSNATSLSGMFRYTFYGYAYGSLLATIPENLFSSIDTSNATDLSYMFFYTFGYFAHSSTIATIPENLFSSIDTSNATNLSFMFSFTFDVFASNSTIATIPAGLFDSFDTANADILTGIFSETFKEFALSSQATTDINTIWGDAFFADNVTSLNIGGYNGIFSQTFFNMPSLTGEAGTFIAEKLDNTNPSSYAGTFYGTSVTDLSALPANWK